MTIQDIKDIIFEAYAQHLNNHPRLINEEDKKTVFQENGQILPDSTEQILAKYPQLRHCLEKLQTEDFTEFIANIDWVSPRPTIFRINLKNGTNFNLKWLGKSFEATISGKRYDLGRLTDYQKALSRLTDLYQEGPMGKDDEEQPSDSSQGGDFSGGGGGGGDFPGGGVAGLGTAAPAEGPESEQPAGEAGNQPEGEAGKKAEDFSEQPIDFESDEKI